MPARKPLLSADAAAFVQGGEPAVQPSPPAAAPAPAAADAGERSTRFTVDMPRSLHKRLKLAALHRDLPMTTLARQALKEWLDSND